MMQHELGLFTGIPNNTYHSGPEFSKSTLDLIARSPLHYRYAMDAKNDNKAETSWQRIGSLTHTLVLEPEKLRAEYADPFVAPDGALRTVDDLKAALALIGEKQTGKRDELIERLRHADPGAVFYDDELAAWDADRGDRAVINTNELALAQAMRDAVMAHPTAGKLFAAGSGAAELSAYWRDAETGLACRCRPDWWRTDGVLVDLKTAEDASPEAFEKSILKYRYHVQAAFYLDGARAVFASAKVAQLPPDHFVFVVVEKTAPHAVSVYRLDDDAIEIGRREYQRDLTVAAECLSAGSWPAYGEAIMRASLPEWALRRALGE